MAELKYNSGRRLSGLVGIIACCVLSSGCFGLWHRIDRDALDRIPNDEKLALFDAENAVIIAKDNIEAVERRISDGRKAVDSAREKMQLLEENPKVAGISSPDVLELYKEWAALRLELRQDEMRHYYLLRDVAEDELWLARASYEMEKARLVHDLDPEKGAGVNLEGFEQQTADREIVVGEGKAKIDESKIILEEVRSRYDSVSQRLQESSGGAFGGPWAD